MRTGSHVTRAAGRESGQFREADLIVASWYQHTSRDGDMQLHTHNQIAHVAITRDDGKGRAPDSTAYYEHARAAGQIASVHAEAAPLPGPSPPDPPRCPPSRTARPWRSNGRSPAAAWSASARTACSPPRSSAGSWSASASSPPR